MIHVSAGSHEVPEVFTVTHPSMFLPDGVNVKYAAEIKKHVKTPVGPSALSVIPSSWKRSSPPARRTSFGRPRSYGRSRYAPKSARGKNGRNQTLPALFACFSCVVTKRQYVCAVNPEIGFEQDAGTS